MWLGILKQAQIACHFNGLNITVSLLLLSPLFYLLNNTNLWLVFRISSLACGTESAGEFLKSGIQVSTGYSIGDPILNWFLDIS